MKAKEITFEEMQHDENGKISDYDFVGFVTEADIPKLKSGYFYVKIGGGTDIVGEIFGGGNRNVYVYKKTDKTKMRVR
jgi:hypothetical protein